MTDRISQRLRLATALRGASRAALVAGLIAGGSAGLAQQTVPGNDPDCPIVGDVATCEGDQSDGIISNPTDPGFDRIVIQNLTGPIAPPGYFAIGVVKEDRDITIEIADDVVISTFDDPGIPGLAQGVIAVVGGNFNLTIDSGAAITADGNGSTAIGMEGAMVGSGALDITNRGDISAFTSGDSAIAISASAQADGLIAISNFGDLSAVSAGVGERERVTAGIRAVHSGGGAFAGIVLGNSGDIIVDAGPDSFDTDFNGIAAGIVTNIFAGESETLIDNSGAISATGRVTHGIVAFAENSDPDALARIEILNTGALSTNGAGSYGILAQARGGPASVFVRNDAAIDMANASSSFGIYALNQSRDAGYAIVNTGAITASGAFALGIAANLLSQPDGSTVDLEIENSGDIALATALAGGIVVNGSATIDSTVRIDNSGDIDLAGSGAGSQGIGVNMSGAGGGGAPIGSTVDLVNSGAITLSAGNAVLVTAGAIDFVNSGRLATSGAASDVVVLEAITGGDGVPRIDFATTGDVIAAGADSSGIVATNRDNDGTIRIGVGAGATVGSGTGSGVGIRMQGAEGDAASITEIVANVTITKAKLADRAMNAITQYITSSVPPGGDPGFGTFALQPTVDFDPAVFGRRIDVLGAVRSDGGAGAIQSDASLLVTVDGGTLATTGAGAPVIAGTESLALVANGATLTSTGADSPLFGIVPGAGTGTATYVNLSGGTATTTGDNSDAFALGSGNRSSVASFVVDADDSDTPAVIATTGDGSRAFSFDALGGSGIGSTLTGIVDNALVTTLGDNAAAFDFRVGSDSSVSLAIADSTVSTAGAGSDLIHLDIANNSDSLFFIENATLTTTGANSRILNAPGAAVNNSLTNLAMIGASLRTEGDGSGAIVLGGAFAGSALTLFAADTGITTLGDDAAAIDFGRIGNGSVMTVTADEVVISTSGDRSGGLVGELTGVGSAFQLTMTGTAIATLGDDAPALGLSGFFDTSAYSASFAGSSFTTEGDRSAGVSLGGTGSSSVFSIDLNDSLISTLGAQSPGLVIERLGASEAVSVVSIRDAVIVTSGAESHGVLIGSGVGLASSEAAFNAALTDRNSWLVQEGTIVAAGAGSVGLLTEYTIERITNSGTISGELHGIAAKQGSGASLGTGGTLLSDGDVTITCDPEGCVITPNDPVVTLGIFENSGTIAATGPGGIAIMGDLIADADDFFVNRNGGQVLGDVLFGGGADNVTTQAGSLIDGDLDTGSGDDVVSLVDGTITGTVFLGDGDDTFLLAQLGSTVVTDGGAGEDRAYYIAQAGDNLTVDLTAFTFTSIERFVQDGAGTLNVTTPGSIFERYEILGGTLNVNADIGGVDILVRSGARLGGTGIVGDVTVTSGTLAAGNSIGTLTVGNLSLDAAATLEVEVSEAAADLIRANGTVALGGSTLAILGIDGANFAGAQTYSYTIVDNDGGDAVSGTFGTIVNDLAFLAASIDYAGGDGNDVVLTLDQTRMFPEVAVTFNQREAAGALAAFDRTPGSDADTVYTEILVATTDQALAAFDTASGEIYAAAVADLATAGMGRVDRLIARGHEGGGEGWGLWIGGALRDARIDDNGNAAQIGGSAFTGELGIDYRGPANGWAVGLSVGYVDGRLEIDDRRSRGDYDGWHLGAYARWGTGNAGFTASAAIDYASLDLTTRRQISIGAIQRTAAGSADLDSLSLAAELRYGLPVGGGWALGPVASVRHADADLGRLTETGANSLDLSVAGGSDGVTRWGAGAFANWRDGRSSLDISAQYVGGSGTLSEIGLALAGAPGQPFAVRAPRQSGGAGLFSVSGGHELGGGWSIGGTLRALTGEDARDLSGRLTLGWRF